jgi:hypothetical protein
MNFIWYHYMTSQTRGNGPHGGEVLYLTFHKQGEIGTTRIETLSGLTRVWLPGFLLLLLPSRSLQLMRFPESR